MCMTEDYVHAFRGPSRVRSACLIKTCLPGAEGEALVGTPP